MPLINTLPIEIPLSEQIPSTHSVKDIVDALEHHDDGDTIEGATR